METYERNLAKIVKNGRDVAALAEELMRQHEENALSARIYGRKTDADASTLRLIATTADNLESSVRQIRMILLHDQTPQPA